MRLRRNPHTERRIVTGRRGRPRIHRQSAVQTPPSYSSAPLVHRTAPDLSDCVVVVPTLTEGVLSAHDADVIGAALELATNQTAALVAVGFEARDRVDWTTCGADYVVRFARPQPYCPEWEVDALSALCSRLSPVHIVGPDHSPGPGDTLRRFAATSGRRFLSGIEAVSGQGIRARTDGGKSEVVGPAPFILLCDPECAFPPSGIKCEAVNIDPPTISDKTNAAASEIFEIAPLRDNMPLDETDFIIAAGNGITDWQAFRSICTRLNATSGGSRVICDAGLMDKSRQIGASGTLVNPVCYFALGISGAPQHLQGIVNCKHVIAVNTDLHAEMIRRADLAIVADAQEVMAALITLTENPKGQSE